MSNQQAYMPGPATGAEVKKGSDTWTLVLVREREHALAQGVSLLDGEH